MRNSSCLLMVCSIEFFVDQKVCCVLVLLRVELGFDVLNGQVYLVRMMFVKILLFIGLVGQFFICGLNVSVGVGCVSGMLGMNLVIILLMFLYSVVCLLRLEILCVLVSFWNSFGLLKFYFEFFCLKKMLMKLLVLLQLLVYLSRWMLWFDVLVVWLRYLIYFLEIGVVFMLILVSCDDSIVQICLGFGMYGCEMLIGQLKVSFNGLDLLQLVLVSRDFVFLGLQLQVLMLGLQLLMILGMNCVVFLVFFGSIWLISVFLLIVQERVLWILGFWSFGMVWLNVRQRIVNGGCDIIVKLLFVRVFVLVGLMRLQLLIDLDLSV